VVQESFNNIVKHAKASEIRVGVERLTDSVTLKIRTMVGAFSMLMRRRSRQASVWPGWLSVCDAGRLNGGLIRTKAKDHCDDSAGAARHEEKTRMAGEIKVFIADDHPIFRHGLRQIIERAPQLVVVDEAKTAKRRAKG